MFHNIYKWVKVERVSFICLSQRKKQRFLASRSEGHTSCSFVYPRRRFSRKTWKCSGNSPRFSRFERLQRAIMSTRTVYALYNWLVLLFSLTHNHSIMRNKLKHYLPVRNIDKSLFNNKLDSIFKITRNFDHFVCLNIGREQLDCTRREVCDFRTRKIHFPCGKTTEWLTELVWENINSNGCEKL